ncbi:MAG: hypothetical protein HW398_498 [Acidobacteria bacterium]|nr:hypothetical protein [Acidobacteriota bacterium]
MGTRQSETPHSNEPVRCRSTNSVDKVARKAYKGKWNECEDPPSADVLLLLLQLLLLRPNPAGGSR